MAATSTLTVTVNKSLALQYVIDALDAMGLALAEHDHQWTPRERELHERAVRVMRDHIVAGIGESEGK